MHANKLVHMWIQEICYDLSFWSRQSGVLERCIWQRSVWFLTSILHVRYTRANEMCYNHSLDVRCVTKILISETDVL